MMNMVREEQKDKCMNLFKELTRKLEKNYTLIGSCNQDESAYLVPNGTEDQVTYHSKPIDSFRISDHWNWKSNVKKCSDEYHIQCWNVDLMRCKKRNGPGLASNPIWAWSIAYFGDDERYHTIFGSLYDYVEHQWLWYEASIDQIMEMLRLWYQIN